MVQVRLAGQIDPRSAAGAGSEHGVESADSFNTSGQWTAGFTYDVLGNVLTATDANGTTITNTYDRAGRVKTRTYSDGTTPAVSFFYDGTGLSAPQTPNYAKGKLTKVTSSVSATEYQLFDNLGRMTQMSQITDGQSYTSKYTYNFSGALVEEEYPSGRKVKNEFESDGDISSIYGNATPSASERTYANTFSYTPDGRLRLGNGLWEKATFNTKLQVKDMMVGHGVGSGDLWKLTYEYGEIDGNGNVDTAKNTGNVARQTLSFNGLANPFVQTYKYDSLYRLTEARETSNSTQTWKQNFSFDRYGNRLTHDKFAGTTQLTLSVPEHPTIETATNRLSSGQGFTFDANGNLIIDAENRGFTFNGDNKQTVVRNLNITPPQQDPDANVIGRYFYDGEGKRIKKVSAAETTVFVYSAGKLIAEYSTATPSNPTASWTVTDQLGSPRVIVNSLGAVVSRRDFMPFGEELDADQIYRKTDHKYGQTDSVRQKFTGYQNDTETGLDFAEVRMYENRFGRFTAVDPLLTSGKSTNPQTFNRYAYTSNNPIARIDVNGKDWYYHRELKIDRFGRTFYRTMIYWRDEVQIGKSHYTGPGIIQETIGDRNGRYTALDPYEGRSASFKTRAEAVTQYQAYLRDRNVNVIRGLVDVLAETVTDNPLAALLYDWGANAVIGRPDPNSNVYTVTNRSTNAMIIVGTAATSGVGIAGMLRGVGQRHHLLTNKIMRALGKHGNLKGVFNRQDARFIYDAADEAAHKGYQKWHRRYDEEVTTWLRNNPEATEEQFVKYLDDLHQEDWLRERIPNVKLE